VIGESGRRQPRFSRPRRHLSLARCPGQARSTSRHSVLVGADRRGPQPVSRPRPEAAPEGGLVLTPARTARCSLVTRRECLPSAHDHHRLRRIGSVAASAGAQAYLGARTAVRPLGDMMIDGVPRGGEVCRRSVFRGRPACGADGGAFLGAVCTASGIGGQDASTATACGYATGAKASSPRARSRW
jgi:hypothetical protein